MPSRRCCDGVIVRRYRPDDFDPVNDLWRRSRLAAFPAAFMAIAAHARALSPSGLRLFTFQVNVSGRAFYEKHGFVIARLGVSPPPESEPDVEYHWRP